MFPFRSAARRDRPLRLLLGWLLLGGLVMGPVPGAGPAGEPGGVGWASAHADDDDDDDDEDDDDDDDTRRARPRSPAVAPPRTPLRAPLLPAVTAPQELVALDLARADLVRLRQRGFVVLSSQRSRLLGAVATRLAAPPGLTAAQALDLLRRTAPRAVADLNHLYRTQQARARVVQPADPCSADTGAEPGAGCWPRQLIAWPGAAAACRRAVVIGMVDTAVDTGHPALAGQGVQRLVLAGSRRDRLPSDADHGTAVASVLVGRPDGPVPGLLPQARLLVVDAFHRVATGPRGVEDRMDAYDLVAALDLLIQRGARVINLSFAGADNALVQRGVAAAARAGVLLVAAVGNQGPRAAALYPAAYPEVLGVTAVGADGRVYRRALQGRQVALAAPGVEVRAADRGGAATLRSGTSMAAPHVSAAAALWLGNGLRVAQVQRLLRSDARDLGALGVDPVFGHGLLQAQRACG